VSEDSIYDVLVLNTGDDPDRSAATTTDLDVDGKNAFQALSPGHGGVALGG
jgi:hypothetical protein